MNLFGSPNIEKMAAERDYDGLYQCLEHRDPMVRLEAAQALADIEDGVGWRFLLESVEKAEDPDLQAAAAAMLGELGHPRAVPALSRALKKTRSGVAPYREDVINALRQALEDIGGAEAEEALTSVGYRSDSAEGIVMGTLGSSLGADEYLAGYTHPALSASDAVQFLSAEEHLNIAVELREAEQAERGLVECSLALWLKPDWAYAWYLRGVLMEDLEREFEAVLAYRQALQFDPSLRDARDALEELEKTSVFPPLDRDVLLTDLNSREWQARRQAAAGLGELAGSDEIDDAVVAQLVSRLEDEEREVRHAVIEALTEISAQSPELALPALPVLENQKESSWLLRFSVIEAIATMGDATRLANILRSEMNHLQERNPVFSSRKDPLLEGEYNRLMELGVLSFERTGDLDGLLNLAEANAWTEVEEEEEDWPDEETEDTLEDEEAVEGEEMDEDEVADEEELNQYVDEVAQMSAMALERMARPILANLNDQTLVRLLQIPDLTLIDLSGEQESAEPVVVHDLSALRAAVSQELQKRGIR